MCTPPGQESLPGQEPAATVVVNAPAAAPGAAGEAAAAPQHTALAEAAGPPERALHPAGRADRRRIHTDVASAVVLPTTQHSAKEPGPPGTRVLAVT